MSTEAPAVSRNSRFDPHRSLRTNWQKLDSSYRPQSLGAQFFPRRLPASRTSFHLPTRLPRHEKVIALAVGGLRGLSGADSRGRRRRPIRQRLYRIIFQMPRCDRRSLQASGARILSLSSTDPVPGSETKIDGCCRADGEWPVLSIHPSLVSPRTPYHQSRGAAAMEI